MDISRQLMQFLSLGDASAPFRLGHWLESLDDKSLALLKSTVDSLELSDDAGTHEDLIEVIVLLVTAEQKRLKPKFNAKETSDLVDALNLMTKIETFRRQKWLLVEQPLSIQPHARVSIRFTPEGLKHADELRRR